jgi:hypothetical protein
MDAAPVHYNDADTNASKRSGAHLDPSSYCNSDAHGYGGTYSYRDGYRNTDANS